MNYLLRIGKRLIIGLLFFQSLSQLQAATTSNYAEMSLALAAIPFDMAAQNHTLAKNTKKAALYHLTANSLSILNKMFYFYNNIAAQSLNGRINLVNKDIVINCSITLLDLKNLYKHFRVLVPAPKKVAAVQTTSDLLDFDFDEDELIPEEILDENETEILDETEVTEEDVELSKLIKTWRIVALPSLKGLTAFALACAQNNATVYDAYSRAQTRNMLTSAHSLTKLLGEYSALELNSGYTKFLIAAIMLNATWLAYEVKQYIATMPEPFRMPTSRGECEICFNDDTQLEHLRCGHAYCRDCLAGLIDTRYNERGVTPLNATLCPHDNCREVISRDEMAAITNHNTAILNAYDEAQTQFGKPEMSPMTDIEIKALGFKRCPNQKCRKTIQKGDACRHVTCTCGHQFCWWCLREWRNHYRNDCGNLSGGQNPNYRQNWNIGENEI